MAALILRYEDGRVLELEHLAFNHAVPSQRAGCTSLYVHGGRLLFGSEPAEGGHVDQMSTCQAFECPGAISVNDALSREAREHGLVQALFDGLEIWPI